MGYQFVPVGNFSITENEAGALRQGELTYISVTDNIFSEMHIAAGFDARVTTGDLRIRNLRTASNLGFLGNWHNTRTGANVSFEIDRESTTPSTITFSNVEVRLAGNVPVSNPNAGYDLIVWGPAIAQNYEGIRPRDDDEINNNDFFTTPGLRAPFINVTGGMGTGTTLTNVVQITPVATFF